ncbi:MAG TPA: SDR family oxidoreductase [Acetobacteraceae bacterium]|nr:SDR family oxidoreductase [Acetobacteraceae bacterium]
MVVNPKTVLITGGGRRIGAAIARDLAARGWVVVIHCRESRREADELAASLGEGRGFVVQADLASEADVGTVIERATALAGPVTALINNASRFVFDSAASVSGEAVRAHMAPNLIAPLILARDFAAALGDHKGVIVNILDQKLHNLNPDFFSYTLSKAALAAATEMLAMALAPRIRVCGVSPGLTLIGHKQTPASFERGWKSMPLEQGSPPEDIARTVAFILETGSITGTTLVVDGGEHLMRRVRDVAFSV